MTSTAALQEQTAHRPWPLPDGPYAMTMRWCDLAFLHWPVDPDLLRPLVPPALSLDVYEGAAWIGVVPFRMENVRLRPFPPILGTDAFPELNVRTYVTAEGRPGVWFLSLDAANRLAVRIARHVFHLPYFDARMRVRTEGEVVHYESYRTHRDAPPAVFSARYRPVGPVAPAMPGTLEHFLTERYCLYAADRKGRVSTVDVHHAPWPLQPCAVQLERNSMAEAGGVTLPDVPPLTHFARRLDVLAWPPRRVAG